MDNDYDRDKSPKKRDESTKKSIYTGSRNRLLESGQIREANTAAAATTKAVSPNTSPRSPINGGDQNQEITDREFESLALLHIAYPPVRCSATDLQTLRQVHKEVCDMLNHHARMRSNDFFGKDGEGDGLTDDGGIWRVSVYHGWQPEFLWCFFTTALNDLDASRALDTCANASRCLFPAVPHPLVICALILIAREGGLKRLFKEWTFVGSLTTSGLPAAIYTLQNSLQLGCKWISLLAEILAALVNICVIEWQKQSIHQIGALFLLIMAAVLLSIGEGSSKGSTSSDPDQILFYGIIPILVASVLSGLASALCQWASQVKKHASYVMTVEMSIVGSLCLLASTFKSPDGEAIIQHGLFYGWTPLTLIPVIFNALGGILVGLVTSYAGGVRKGFVIVSALLVTASLQFIFDGKPPSLYCLLAFPLVISSISIYQKYPYPVKKKES
ncbi:nucleotide-sugar transporter family protein [Actinidia rufa]|uniref:Nucleotide-sugar transporter family protein n=1 Tax=Actinidia rufa TaxID=165716 RepID=A0A7J0E2A7_9ERIC|nr:nucleotide-sugar transporter family protein [Actinidia rufa]